MTAARHNCDPPCSYDANLGAEHLLNSLWTLSINSFSLWANEIPFDIFTQE